LLTPNRLKADIKKSLMKKKASKKITALGITGGIGSGKTDVCRIFESMGASVYQADLVARELIDSRSDIKRKIKGVFGEGVFLSNGKLDRKKTAELIFSNRKLQLKLNGIVHPPVIQYLKSEIRRAKASGKYPVIAIEAALIYEARTERMFDYVLVVKASKKERIRRVMLRDKSGRSAITRRISAQLPASKKVNRADFVIDNSGTRKTLEDKCRFLYRLFMNV